MGKSLTMLNTFHAPSLDRFLTEPADIWTRRHYVTTSLSQIDCIAHIGPCTAEATPFYKLDTASDHCMLLGELFVSNSEPELVKGFSNLTKGWEPKNEFALEKFISIFESLNSECTVSDVQAKLDYVVAIVPASTNASRRFAARSSVGPPDAVVRLQAELNTCTDSVRSHTIATQIHKLMRRWNKHKKP